MNDEAARIFHKVHGVLEATSMFLVLGAIFLLPALFRLFYQQRISRWVATSLAAGTCLLVLGVTIGCYEVWLCSLGRHDDEKWWHGLLLTSLFLQFFPGLVLLIEAPDGRKGAAASAGVGLLVLQLGVFLTFEITFNGFG